MSGRLVKLMHTTNLWFEGRFQFTLDKSIKVDRVKECVQLDFLGVAWARAQSCLRVAIQEALHRDHEPIIAQKTESTHL